MAGGLLEADLKATVVAAGFVDFEIPWRADVFGGVPQSSSAASFGTVGINFRARKAGNEAEWADALAALVCELPRQNGHGQNGYRKGDPGVSLMKTNSPSRFGADAFYEAGDRGCAEGPLDDIAALMRRLSPGQTLEIHTTDPSVATDLPAWCRLAGHDLVAQEEGYYLLRRRN